MHSSQLSYTFLRSRLLLSWQVTFFKWLLVAVGVALTAGGVMMTLHDVSNSGALGTMALLAMFTLERARDLETLPKSSDSELPKQVEAYRQLSGRPWASTASQIEARVPTVSKTRTMMANPLTWRRKQRVLTIHDPDLTITLYETNGVVGKVKLGILEPLGPGSQQALQEALQELENTSMGLDLDILIEIRHGERWQWRGGPVFKSGQQLDEDIFIPRNRTFYDLFERRSLPEDLSDALRTGIRKTWGDPPEATYTWLTFQELLSMESWIPPEVRYLYDRLVGHAREVGQPPDAVRLILQFS